MCEQLIWRGRPHLNHSAIPPTIDDPNLRNRAAAWFKGLPLTREHDAWARHADGNIALMGLAMNPDRPTREELVKLRERRPVLWNRFHESWCAPTKPKPDNRQCQTSIT